MENAGQAYDCLACLHVQMQLAAKRYNQCYSMTDVLSYVSEHSRIGIQDKGKPSEARLNFLVCRVRPSIQDSIFDTDQLRSD